MDVKQNELSQDSAQRRASLTTSYFRVLLQKIQLVEFNLFLATLRIWLCSLP